MYLKIIIISLAVVILWTTVIQPTIDELLFQYRMRKDDEEMLKRKRSCECTPIMEYRKKYFPKKRA